MPSFEPGRASHQKASSAMTIEAVKKKFIIELTAGTVVLSAVAAAVFRFLIPGWYFAWFPLIPVFFFLFGLLYIYLFAFGCMLGPGKIAMTYLVGKVLKLVLSIFVLLFYGFVIGKDVVSFVAAFIVFYFAFLFFETRFFLRFEAKLKLSKQANNEKITVHSNDTAAVAGGSDAHAESGNGR